MELIRKIILSSKYHINIMRGKYLSPLKKKPMVMSLEDTLEKILVEKKSLCRFGDGEFNVIFGGDIGFQEKNEQLGNALKNILSHPIEGCLIGLPGIFGDLSGYRDSPREFWYSYRGEFDSRIYSLLDRDITYADTNVTRFQTGFNDKLDKRNLISRYREIWDSRDIVFIEGDKTRMGIGNDLFCNAGEIKRILTPSENAFDKLTEIENCVRKNVSKDKLIIIACGPTATVLAYDLCKMGYQALDFGHLDIQYEYFQRGIISKSAIPGKYTNEANQRNVVECEDEDYRNSIIARINEGI
jgi:glycosyltransferase family protein